MQVGTSLTCGGSGLRVAVSQPVLLLHRARGRWGPHLPAVVLV